MSNKMTAILPLLAMAGVSSLSEFLGEHTKSGISTPSLNDQYRALFGFGYRIGKSAQGWWLEIDMGGVISYTSRRKAIAAAAKFLAEDHAKKDEEFWNKTNDKYVSRLKVALGESVG